MDFLERNIKRERNKRYKALKKIWKARDMVSKHFKKTITLKSIVGDFNEEFIKYVQILPKNKIVKILYNILKGN